MSSVGKSHRTPFKHWVLDKTLGSIAGRVGKGKVRFIFGDFHVVDLCAGDGEPGEHGMSSPEIIAKHCRWVQAEFKNRGQWNKAKATLIEKSPHTFEKLSKKEEALGSGYSLELILGDARDYRVSATKNQSLFINADPNHIKDMPLADGLVESFPQFTTMTLTLGCNVGGIKRRPIEERAKWFEYVDMCCNRMKTYHDAVLCTVKNDGSRWAYMSVIPKKDSSDYVTSLIRKGSKEFKHGVEVASFRESSEEWGRLTKWLFLTQKEAEEGIEYANAT